MFRFTDVTCGKDPARKVSSVAFLTKGTAWVNVQLVDGGPTKSVRVQRYRRAIDQKLADGSQAPLPSARMLAAAPPADGTDWNVDDVIEASAKLPADAVQAAITEDRGPYELNKKNLVAMNKASVPETVIDLMIALTYPQRFVVQRAGGSSYAPSGISTGGGWFDPFMMSPLAYTSMYDCYGMGYRTYYATCGSIYSPYGAYYNGYYNGYGGYYPGYGGGWVVVDPNPGTPDDARSRRTGRERPRLHAGAAARGRAVTRAQRQCRQRRRLRRRRIVRPRAAAPAARPRRVIRAGAAAGAAARAATPAPAPRYRGRRAANSRLAPLSGAVTGVTFKGLRAS